MAMKAFYPCKHDAHGRPLLWNDNEQSWHESADDATPVFHCKGCGSQLVGYFLWNDVVSQHQCCACAIKACPFEVDNPEWGVLEQIFAVLQFPIPKNVYDDILTYLHATYPALQIALLQERASYAHYIEHCARLASMRFDVTVNSFAAFYQSVRSVFLHVPTWAVYQRMMQMLMRHMLAVHDGQQLRLVFELEASRTTCKFYYCLVGEVAAKQVSWALAGTTLTPYNVMHHFNVPPNKFVYYYFARFLKAYGHTAPDFVELAALVMWNRVKSLAIFDEPCVTLSQNEFVFQLKTIFITLPWAIVYKRTVLLLMDFVENDGWKEYLLKESYTFDGYLMIAKDLGYMKSRETLQRVIDHLTACDCVKTREDLFKEFFP